jgi:sugar O-acyltransferase (sialic acid O-acetyltransferase NeuD family)
MQDLVIVGAGGHGREVLQCARDMNAHAPQWNVLGFVDDAFVEPRAVGDVSLLGRVDYLAGRSCAVVVAIGAPAVRCQVVLRLRALGVSNFATLIHPSVIFGARVVLGAGTTVAAGAILTTDIVIGEHVVVNTAAVVSHDCRVDNFSTLAPRVTLCGASRLGEGVEMGAAASVMPGLSIEPWAKVGAGACVTSAVRSNETVVGVPATCVRRREMNWQDVS